MKRKVDYALSQKAVVHRDDDNADQVQARIYAVEKDECVLQKNF